MMKFSYRLFALIFLFITLVMVYLFFGDELLRKKTQVRPHDLIGSKIRSSNWYSQVTSSRSPGFEDGGECRLAERDLPTYGIHTYDLFNKMKPSYQSNAVFNMNMDQKGKGKAYKDKLTVFLMPHSHNDPGWLQTLGQYYQMQTRPILDNMLSKLEKYPNMTFIWAETVFLSMWWDDIGQRQKQRVRRLIDRGQLEIVNGGWVAPDEASTHYFAIIDQLIEGHQWLQENLKVKPEISWSPDPFGYSSTMPYILNRAGVQDMVILRIHDEIKAELRKNQNLEFHWRQLWDKPEGDTDTFCHLLPYVLYSIKHSCGPDPYICLMFDFRKIPGEYGEGNPPTLSNSNIEKYAKYLFDEFRAKSEHFRHNVILYPLGDDFRFDREIEWTQQYENYNKLFNYMNSRKDWNIEAKFGTLKDYFAAIKQVERSGKLKGRKFPTLFGGFFPYMDRDDEYWTGYFTTRPFYKQLERELESNLRSAEILNSLALAYQTIYKTSYRQITGTLKMLTTARRNLALFQHHDAITGTSKPHTVQDYEIKLWEAKELAKVVMITATQYLLLKDVPGPPGGKQKEQFFINIDDARNGDTVLPTRKLVTVTLDGVKVIIFNPVAKNRYELVRLRVSSAKVKVTDSMGNNVVSQINPIWVSADSMSVMDFEVVFYADLPPLGMISFLLTDVPKARPKTGGVANLATLFFTDKTGPTHDTHGKNEFVIRGIDKAGLSKLVLENSHIRAKFRHDGLLTSITRMADDHLTDIAVSFLMYSSRGSGAYIFMPQGRAMPDKFTEAPSVVVLRGPLLSEVRVNYPALVHVVRVLHTDKPIGAALEVDNYVDMQNGHDFMDKEIIMRFYTSVKNDHIWYSDLNGFQTVRHKSHKKYSITGNYHPMTTMAYIEGNNTRFSVLCAQSHGATSLKSGSLEVMLDRKLSSDDNRGLGEGVYDNQKTISQFRLLVERSQSRLPRDTEETKSSFPSLLSLVLSDQLRHPTNNFIVYKYPEHFLSSFAPLLDSLPCDVNIVNMKVIASKYNSSDLDLVLILHREGLQCGFEASDLQCRLSDGVIESIFRDVRIKQIQEVTLSLMYKKRNIVEKKLKLDPMEIATYSMSFESQVKS